MSSPRLSIGYTRMKVDLIPLLEENGPQTIETIRDTLDWSLQQWRDVRYSLGGRLALEDSDYTMPRPVANEGYVYKLAQNIRSGDVATDGEPNIVMAVTDLLTRHITLFAEVEKLEKLATPRSATRRLRRKLRQSMDNSLEHMETLAVESGAPVSDWANYTLERLAT